MPNSAPDAPDQEMSRLSIEPPRQSYLLPHILLTNSVADYQMDSGNEEMDSGTDDESCSEQHHCDTCDCDIGQEAGVDCWPVNGYNLCEDCYLLCCFPCGRQNNRQCQGTEPMLHADVGTRGSTMFMTLEEMGFRLIHDDAMHGTHYCCENCLTEEERQAEAQAEAETRN